jgi:hypothetical protein
VLAWEDETRRVDNLIERVATRSQARVALVRISEQGEAAPEMFTESHFARFLSIKKSFERFREDAGIDWEPSHRIADDPHTLLPTEKRRPGKSTITDARSRKWADLFDLRYHMLLAYLSHSFHLSSDGKQAALLGGMIHKTFGEMYNLKAIAGILVERPLKDPPNDFHAGPPFRMPKSLTLPKNAVGRWQLHGDLIKKALKLNNSVMKAKAGAEPEHASYLRAMEELDRNSADWIKKVIAGLKRGRIGLSL